MSDQRAHLGKFINQRIEFKATVGEFTHKKIRGGGKGPVLLLLDLEQVDKKGRTIQSNLADHVWVNANKSVFSLGKELFPGDEIGFSGLVKTYSIHRDDVLDRRKNIIDAAKNQNQRMFSDYREQYVDWKDNWQSVLEQNKSVKKQLHDGLIDRSTMQQMEQQNIEAYKNLEPNGVVVKKIETSNLAAAEKRKHAQKLVDYQIEDLADVKFLKQKRLHKGWVRKNIKVKDRQNIRFTKYLAARSFAYRDGVPYDVFDNK